MGDLTHSWSVHSPYLTIRVDRKRKLDNWETARGGRHVLSLSNNHINILRAIHPHGNDDPTPFQHQLRSCRCVVMNSSDKRAAQLQRLLFSLTSQHSHSFRHLLHRRGHCSPFSCSFIWMQVPDDRFTPRLSEIARQVSTLVSPFAAPIFPRNGPPSSRKEFHDGILPRT